MPKIKSPDFLYTYRHTLSYAYQLNPRTHRVITEHPTIFATPGKDAELLSALVWLYEADEEQITSDIPQLIEFDLIYSTLLTHTIEDDELAKAIFNLASTLRTSHKLTIENLRHIIRFPSINNPRYYPKNDDAREIENVDLCAFMRDLSNYLSTTGRSQLINCAHMLSFLYQHDLINHSNFTSIITYVADNNAILNNINLLLEDVAGIPAEDYLKTLFKTEFISTGELNILKKILNTLKQYGELSPEKIQFIFSSIEEKINLNLPQEIQPSLENTLNNILNFTFFEINENERQQLLSNLDAIDALFDVGLTLSELLLFDVDMRKMMLDTISENNIEMIHFFINQQKISPFLFFSSYASKEILDCLSDITFELERLGELNDVRREQLFKNILSEMSKQPDSKKCLCDQLLNQLDAIIKYDFFDLAEPILLQLKLNQESMDLIWHAGISLAKFASLNNELRRNAIQNITARNAEVVRFFSYQGVPTELFFNSETLSIIDDITIILMRDNADEIPLEELSELYFRFQEYFLVLRRNITAGTISDFFQINLDMLQHADEKMPVCLMSQNRAGFFSTATSSGQNKQDGDHTPPSPSHS